MARFEECLRVVLQHEGGYVNHPSDPGGATNKGITQKVYDGTRAREGKAPQPVKDISDAEVAAIYKAGYWDVSGAGQLRPPLDLLHFDAAVNHGPGRAAGFLKVSAGNPRAYLAVREQFYHTLVAKNPKLVVFLKGWLNRIASLRREAGL